MTPRSFRWPATLTGVASNWFSGAAKAGDDVRLSWLGSWWAQT